MKSGLLPTPHDSRDVQLGAFITLPKLSEIPDNFDVGTPIIKDQRDSDFCTGFMAAGMSELQEGVELSAEWSFAKSKELSGDPNDFGQNIRTAMEVHRKFGAVPAKDAPYTIMKKPDSFLRFIQNWPHLEKKAIPHIKQSYAAVSGPYDAFDNIRATLWRFRAEKRAVSFGVYFDWPIKQVFLDTIPEEKSPHAMYIFGARKVDGVMYLRIANSFGKKAGESGVHLISREVVNHLMKTRSFGAYTFVDMPIEQIRYMIENGITDRDNWVIQLMKSAVTLLTELLALKKKENMTLNLPLSPADFEKVSQHFGVLNKRLYPRTGMHIGTDWAVPVGTQLFAICDGKVTKTVPNHKELGNVAYFSFIFQDVWYTARFCHLKGLPKKVDYAKGEPFALSGKTGKVEGAHLHLDIQIGAPTFDNAKIATAALARAHMIDPYRFLRDHMA